MSGLTSDGRLAPVLGILGLVGGAIVMALLAGAIGGAVAAAVAIFVGAAVAWSAERLRARMEESVPGSDGSMTPQIERQFKSIKRLAIYDPNTALYHRWYFELRLAEEIHRCQRYGLSVAVLYFRLGKAPTDPTLGLEGNRGTTANHLAQITSHVVRSVDILANMGQQEYAVCLPHSDAAGAEAALARLEKELSEYDAEIGAAVYPTDASDAESLVACARERTAPPALRQAA